MEVDRHRSWTCSQMPKCTGYRVKNDLSWEKWCDWKPGCCCCSCGAWQGLAGKIVPVIAMASCPAEKVISLDDSLEIDYSFPYELPNLIFRTEPGICKMLFILCCTRTSGSSSDKACATYLPNVGIVPSFLSPRWSFFIRFSFFRVDDCDKVL